MFLRKIHIDSLIRYQDIKDKATQNFEWTT